MEPERRIEKWLRAFAKKRRDQAGPPIELRSANRERLQREVAREIEGQGNRGGFLAQFILRLRPGLVFAMCFIALALIVWAVLPRGRNSEGRTLTMNKSSEAEEKQDKALPEMSAPKVVNPQVAEDQKAQPPPPIASPAVAPTIASANRAPVASSDGIARERDRADNFSAQKREAGTTAATSPPAGDLSFAFKNETAANSTATAGALAKDNQSTARSAVVLQGSNVGAGTATFAISQLTQTRAASQKLATASAPSSEGLFDAAKIAPITNLIASQQFNRVDISGRRSAAGAPATPSTLLTSFRVEQNGNDMKVVDADGSVYTGSVQIAQQEPSGVTIASATPQNTPASRLLRTTSPPPQNYFFRVAGTNRSSQQNIVFSGNFVPFTNYQPATNIRAFGGFGGGAAPTAGLPVEARLSNSQINGTITVDDQKAVNVIATPAR
jgi:hypothetical protein